MRLTPVQRLVSLVKERKVHSLREACDALNYAPKKIEKLVEEAKKLNFAIDFAGEALGIKPAEPSDDITDIRVAKVDNWHKFFVISDPHFGSKYHQRKYLEDFVNLAYGRGCRTGILTGDNLDGCYRHGRWELTHHGFQEQVSEFCKGLPKKPGLKWFGISGNHDETFERECGLIVHESIQDHFLAQGRTDLTMLGARGATIRLRESGERRGVVVELWHPLKGPAYALTYGLQKKVETYVPGNKPDILLTGHWHQSTYGVIRGVHAFSCGTFQGQGSSFGKALGSAPALGGWIIEVGTTNQGTLRCVRPEWISYFQHESIRDV